MPDYGATDRVRRSAAEQYVRPARARRQSTLQIHSGTLEKTLVQQGVLQPNRFPLVCNALRSRKFLTENSLELVDVKAPPSGQSSTAIFTYRLAAERPSIRQAITPSSPTLLDLRGVLKSTYKKLGGAEQFHEQQREGWSR
jgi:hypothetical protein